MPRTAAHAEALAELIAFEAADWGRGFVAQRPAGSRQRTVAVLDEDCDWQRTGLPPGVLAALSRYGELPGRGDKGTVKVMAAVTIHASELGADEQLATTLEEALRCPDQLVRGDEWITGLKSMGSPFGVRQNSYDQYVYETGHTVSDEGSFPYRWLVVRSGTVAVAASVRGAKGYTAKELEAYGTRAISLMLERAQNELKGTR